MRIRRAVSPAVWGRTPTPCPRQIFPYTISFPPHRVLFRTEHSILCSGKRKGDRGFSFVVKCDRMNREHGAYNDPKGERCRDGVAEKKDSAVGLRSHNLGSWGGVRPVYFPGQAGHVHRKVAALRRDSDPGRRTRWRGRWSGLRSRSAGESYQFADRAKDGAAFHLCRGEHYPHAHRSGRHLFRRCQNPSGEKNFRSK